MAGQDGAAGALLGRLAAEPAPEVRAAIVTALIAIGTAEVAAGLVALLGSEDAALRNHAVEALQRLGPVAAGPVLALLDHADPDRRIVAVKVLEAHGDDDILARLRGMLARDGDLNVCLAVVEALGLFGRPEDVPALHAFASRFAEEPAVRFAVDLVVPPAAVARPE
jgi:HEAT repeat protein